MPTITITAETHEKLLKLAEIRDISFKVGEKLTIKESIFEIVEIRPKGMNLKLLKRGL